MRELLRRLLADTAGVTALECGMITAAVMVVAIIGLNSHMLAH